MDYSAWLDAIKEPLWEEKDKKAGGCPPGYVFDKRLMMCVPKTQKDKVGDGQRGDKDMKPGNGAGYNVWGSTGYDGSGYAWEEPPTQSADEGTY